jgi:hypothetical protein
MGNRLRLHSLNAERRYRPVNKGDLGLGACLGRKSTDRFDYDPRPTSPL